MIKKVKVSLFNEIFKDFLFKVHSKTQILFGGAGSSKSVHSAFKDIFRVLNGKNVLVVRKVYGTIYDSYYQELKKAVEFLDLGQYFEFKKTPLRINCSNGKVILFRGLDNVEKVKGITVPNGSIDHFTIEEATEVFESDFNQLQFRSRGGGEKIPLSELSLLKEQVMSASSLADLTSTDFIEFLLKVAGVSKEDAENSSKTVTLLLNPVDINCWIYKTFFEPIQFDIAQKVYHTDNLYIMHSDHWDNQFLTVQDHIKYEQYRFINEYFYNVYCRGHWGVLGEIVFRKFYMSRMTDDYIKRLPQKGIRFGLDFGWNDPFTIVKCHIDHNTRVIHILDEFYRSKVETDQMIGITRSFVGMSQVICDSADPRNIDTLQTHGVMAIGAYKPSGHKERAWIWLQSYMMYIDIDRCPNFAREMSTYQWQKDNNGRVIQKLQDGNDHALDAFIYSINLEIMNSSEGKSYG